MIDRIDLAGPCAALSRRGAELANSITHGVGFVLSVAALSVLVCFAAFYGSARHVVACSIYGASLVILYLASTLYHSIQAPRAKRVFKIIDHAAIYLLIAGTYTPFTLISLRGAHGWTVFGIIWGLALLGIIYKVVFIGRWKAVSTAIYLAMGWMCVTSIGQLLESLTPGGVAWLAAGGLAYTFGVIFYAWHRLPFSHAVWHLFVLAGSACHFVAVLFYVLPLRA